MEQIYDGLGALLINTRCPAQPAQDDSRSVERIAETNADNVSGIDTPTNILDLPDSCLVDIFEKLSIFHLAHASETCLRFKALADYVFNKNHGSFDMSAHVYFNRVRLTKIFQAFGPLIQKMRIKHLADSGFYINTTAKYCTNLRELKLLFANTIELRNMTKEFTALEKLTIIECRGTHEDVATLLMLSPNLKCFIFKCFTLHPINMVSRNTYTKLDTAGDSASGHFEQFINYHPEYRTFDVYFESKIGYGMDRFCYSWYSEYTHTLHTSNNHF